MISTLLSAVGLAAPAGLNAYLPLLIVALADRFTNQIELDRPYDFVSSNVGIAVIMLLLTIELVADKIPGIDHANDLIQTAVRPASGAFVAMAAAHDGGDLNPVVAMILGLLLAGVVHAVKAITRPVITVSTGGIGNPIVSLIEDGIAVVAALTALLLPLLVLVLVPLLGLLLLATYQRLKRPRPPSRPAPAPTLRR